MWYFAEIVFAEPKAEGRRMYACETSEVLLRAGSANEAYSKAWSWAERRLQEATGQQQIVGVARLFPTLDEEISDGMELGGFILQKRDIWENREKLIPPKERLSAFLFESRANAPLGEVLSEVRGPKAASLLKRLV
jgi:hypothetical protein